MILNDKLVRAENTNIPTAQLLFALWIKTTAAAARTLVVDYISLTAGR